MSKNSSGSDAHAFDKILKENLEATILPLMEQLMNIRIRTFEKLTQKLQVTLEREPDFIRIVETETQERFILHLEFQTNNDTEMVFRMAEYKAIIQRKYRIPVRQFVVYIGNVPPSMRTKLTKEEVIEGFELVNISGINYRKLLESEVPEAIILAILSDFQDEDPVKVIKLILANLKRLSSDSIRLRKYIKQLEILSRLRKLEEITIKASNDMPITYDITTDFLYKKGKLEGKAEGKLEGKAEGKLEGKLEGKEEEQFLIARNLLQSAPFLEGRLSYQDIADGCGLSLEMVKQIHTELSK